jgi:hypothetical protein
MAAGGSRAVALLPAGERVGTLSTHRASMKTGRVAGASMKTGQVTGAGMKTGRVAGASMNRGRVTPRLYGGMGGVILCG